MICASCGGATEVRPCAACAGEPWVDGRYRLDRVLGQGATGVTYAGARVEDGAVFALKEMPLRRADSPKARALVEREVRVLRALDHPQIPRWEADFLVGSGKAATLWLVQELVEGADLARLAGERRLDERDVLGVLAGLLPVLAYLHGRSPPVVHRDLKPRNVLRRPDGRLVLVDFGAVRDTLVDPDLGGSTVAGTFGFMAPEQFRGDASPATDIHGLGALALALLSGRDPATMATPRGLDWERAVDVSPETRRLLRGMLAPEVEDRIPDVAGVAAAMGGFLPAPRPAEPPASGAWGWAVVVWLAAIAIVFLIALFQR